MKNTALLVIDFINDIVNPKGKIASSADYIEKHHVIENANKAIDFARQHDIGVVLVKVGFSANYLECPEISPVFSRAKQLKALQLNTWGTEFVDELNIKTDDFVVIKHRVSAFYATSLETFLRANAIQRILICGVSTDMSVEITAREAHDRDYKVIIIGDACGTGSKELQECALKLLQKIATILNTDDLEKELI